MRGKRAQRPDCTQDIAHTRKRGNWCRCHETWEKNYQVPGSLLLQEVRKCLRRSLAEACDSPISATRRLFVHDRYRSQSSDRHRGRCLCVTTIISSRTTPEDNIRTRRRNWDYDRAARIPTTVPLPGTKACIFVEVHHSRPTEADFLAHYGLIVDIRNRRLSLPVYARTNSTLKPQSIKVITGDILYGPLLAQFLDLIKPSGELTLLKHGTVHHIFCCRPTRLASTS